MLARGANPSAASARRSPIHVAIGWSNPGCLRLLLDHGADLTAVDLSGNDGVALVSKEGYECEECRALVLGAAGRNDLGTTAASGAGSGDRQGQPEPEPQPVH